METSIREKISLYVSRLSLTPHPEGGYYASVYRSTELIPAVSLPDRFKADRVFSTSIYFLLEGNQFSAFHRIRSDELWHFYEGCALNIYVIHPDGRGEVLKLGASLEDGERFQQVVPAGCWFASRPALRDSYSLVGCTVAPGFDFSDFELAEKKKLLSDYPQHERWICELSLD
jgi:predicted cupin superfamily sugar epimerase